MKNVSDEYLKVEITPYNKNEEAVIGEFLFWSAAEFNSNRSYVVPIIRATVLLPDGNVEMVEASRLKFLNR